MNLELLWPPGLPSEATCVLWGPGLESPLKCARSCSQREGAQPVLGGELVKSERMNELKLVVSVWPVMASGPRQLSASRTGTAWLRFAQGPTETCPALVRSWPDYKESQEGLQRGLQEAPGQLALNPVSQMWTNWQSLEEVSDQTWPCTQWVSRRGSESLTLQSWESDMRPGKRLILSSLWKDKYTHCNCQETGN